MKQTEEKRLPYATWKVGEREYKLKLTTGAIMEIETQVLRGGSLMDVISSGNPPGLALQLTITQKAMQKYEHGIDMDDVKELFDQYLEEGGDQITFITDVFMPIFRVSGFFPKKAEAKMGKQLKQVKQVI